MRTLLLLMTCCAAVPACRTDPVTARYPVHCFQSVRADGSTVSLQFIEYVDAVVGIFDYAFEDQDGAYGTFTGTLADNVINAEWSYAIEGAQQIERILIRVDGNRAYRAHGELVADESGELSLKDPGNPAWSESLSRVSCDREY